MHSWLIYMRTIERQTQFKRDYKRESKGKYGRLLDRLLSDAITKLAEDKPLAARYQDHPLTGSWNDHRDCHLKPDLLLLYRKPDEHTLQLVRLGSHAELGF